MDHLEKTVIEDTSAPFFREIIVLILCSHCLLRINAVQIFKVWTVVFDHFAENLSLNLLQKLLQCISINKKALPGRVSM